MKLRAIVPTLTLAALCGFGVAAAVNPWVPFPTADVWRGSEEAFALGLDERELPPRAMPIRWTKRRTLFRFRHLPSGPLTLHVRIQGHRTPVLVGADGLVVANLAPGSNAADVRLPARRAGASLDVVLRTEGFVAEDGRRLGAQLGAVSVSHARALLPNASLVLAFVIPAVVCCLGALLAGFGAFPALALAAGFSIAQGLILTPCGVVRSPYAWLLASTLVVGAGLAAALSRVLARWMPRAAGASYASLLVVFLVHGVLATSPLLLVTDVNFQAHMLHNVTYEGDYFPTSVTQHAIPFRIPYGISFFAALAPFVRAGFGLVAAVRWGAAVAGMLASWGLFVALAGKSPRLAAISVILLQLMPGTFVPFAQGNLPNVFGQAMTTLFFSWWIAWRGRSAWSVIPGAVFLVLAALAHFSSLIVIVTLMTFLLLTARDTPRARRQSFLACSIGIIAIVLYYSHFTRLVAGQVPRLLDSAGGTGIPLMRRLYSQLHGMSWEWWSLPAAALAWFGRPRNRHAALDAGLIGYWLAGVVLLVAAVMTPLEVRYLYALTVAVALCAARGFLALSDGSRLGKLAGGLLVAGHFAIGAVLLGDRLLP
ncbi:MAG: hypothetical protein JXO72_10050 [Vicinamibacteria bacterium]|nr:hypothetical protein [Vicinamibacteria bacterium]